jgi:TonB family protein
MAVTYIQYLPDFSIASAVSPEVTAKSFPYEIIPLGLYVVIPGFFLIRLLFRLAKIIGFRIRCKPVEINHRQVYQIRNQVGPFSFFNWIFIHPEKYQPAEIHEILTHELVHVRQHHSFDILLSELTCVFCWFNPFARMLRHEVHRNLEFLTDSCVVRSGIDSQSYQLNLVRSANHPSPIFIANQFKKSPLKERIIMLNSKQSSKIKLIAYTLLLPFAFLFLIANNAGAIVENIEIKAVIEKAAEIITPGEIVRSVAQSTEPVPFMTNSNDNRGNAEKNVPVVVGDTIQSMKSPEILEELIVVGYGTQVISEQDRERLVYTVVDEPPTFPGGDAERTMFLAKTIKYPVLAQENGIQGRILCSFIVEPTGEISNVKVVNGVDPLLDREAQRVLFAMPPWNPGKQKGVAVPVLFMMPVSFRLQGVSESSAITETDVTKNLVSLMTTAQSDPIKETSVVYVNGEVFPGTKLQTIEPKNIESISVIKKQEVLDLLGFSNAQGIILIITENKTEKDIEKIKELEQKLSHTMEGFWEKERKLNMSQESINYH